jgi:single-stranded-DNA-specific exonuclease
MSALTAPAAQSETQATASEPAAPPPGAAVPETQSARIELPPYDLASALALERELGVSHVLAQVLVRRGLDSADAVRELLAADVAHAPSAFAGIDSAVALIREHVAAGHRITVHGDYDVDGVCATAIMVRALRSIGADADWYLPSRLQDGYGLQAAALERLAQRGTRLLVSVDCGITAIEEVALARSAGIDVVITDHHPPRTDGGLPDCPIVHPSVCGYPCAELCGAAVAHKLTLALGASSAAADIELVALATVTDLVPLRGENRRIVREGLAALAGTARPGLRALMEVSGTDPSALDSRALGFRLGPRINAAGRLARADAGLELLLTEDPARAREIAAELDDHNARRRAVEQAICIEAEMMIRALGPRPAYVLAGEGWHPGVVGIVASRVVERHHRPAFVIALDGDREAQGSARGITGFDVVAALHACAEHLLRYGGHRMAAGLSVVPARVTDLRDAIEAHAERVLTPELLEPVERVDAVVSGGVLGLELAEELESLEPCGVGNPGVTLLVPGARFADVRAIGEGRHVRFTVGSGGARASAVSFGCDGKLPGADKGPRDGTFRLERNVWRGIVEPRLVLRQSRPCDPGPIEVLGDSRDYLAAALGELDAPLEPAVPEAVRALRTVLDRRGEGPLGVLADARAAASWTPDGEALDRTSAAIDQGTSGVLAICADIGRRLAGLSERSGGFALISHAELERSPHLPGAFKHLVVLDPPASRRADELIREGSGYTHLAWGDAELRFAVQMHELEYGASALRTSLVALYRSLRLSGRVAGEELERLLRGDGPHGRPARLAGRLVRVLAELGLVSLDRHLPALVIASEQRTALERSAAYRVYAGRYEDGLTYLNRATHRQRA